MNFDYYKNDLPYPRREEFTKTFFYQKGKVVAEVPPGDSVKLAEAMSKFPNALRENDVDKDAYRKALDAYGQREGALRDQFKADCFKDLGLPENEFTEKLYNMAWEDGHSAGYSEVYNCFSNLSDLHDLAKRVYGK